MGAFSVKTLEEGVKYPISVPDIYSEEVKDIIFRVKIKALDSPRPASTPLISYSLVYRCLTTETSEITDADATLQRPATVDATKLITHQRIDEQRNRINSAKAIENA